MAIVNVSVNKRMASVDAGVELVCNNPTDTINFIFDDEWAAYPSKIATFAWGGRYVDVAFYGNQVKTPEIFNTNYVYVGVYADGIASTPAKVNCKRSILCVRGDKHSVPEHADFTAFMEAAQEVADCGERLSTAEKDIDALENYEKRPFELTGNPIQMQNFEGMPLKVVTAFEPQQSGSGDPYPAGGGKNKLPITRASGGTTSGITYTMNPDGTVTLNGTATSETYISLNPGGTLIPAGEYRLSGAGSGCGNSTHAMYTVIDGGKYINDFGNSPPFTLDTEQSITVYISVRKGVTLDNVIYYPMISLKSETDRTFAPYENIRPISGWDALELTRSGKNLFDKSAAVQNAFWSYASNVISTAPFDGSFASALMFVEEGETYTLSNYVSNAGVALVKFWTDIGVSGNGIRAGDAITCDGSEKVYTFTVPSGIQYVSITGDMANINDVQLELGSVATAYEPFAEGDTYTAQPGQTVYGGRMDWTKGELLVEYEKIVLDGVNTSVATIWENALYACTNLYGRGYKMPRVEAKGACSHFPVNSKAVGSDCVHFSHDNLGCVYIGAIPGVNGADAYNAYLQANPITCVYEIQEPYIIQLTPNDIAALDGINTIYGDGEITVSGRKDILWLTSDIIERIKTLEKAVATLENTTATT